MMQRVRRLGFGLFATLALIGSGGQAPAADEERFEVFSVKAARPLLVDTVTASKRRGINRVVWPMRVKPARVPRAATIAFSASQGPRVLPGTYTVRYRVLSVDGHVVVGAFTFTLRTP